MGLSQIHDHMVAQFDKLLRKSGKTSDVQDLQGSTLEMVLLSTEFMRILVGSRLISPETGEHVLSMLIDDAKRNYKGGENA